MPWLTFDDEITFGKATIAGWSRVQASLAPDVRETTAKILAGFRDTSGDEVESSLCWFTERSPTSRLTEEDVEVLRDHIQIAALSAVSSNPYLTPRDQVNATHFRCVYQNFVPGTETIGLVRRRRDGHTNSLGWSLDELRITAPPAAERRPSPSFDQAFLDALTSCLDASDETSEAIRQSLTPFLRGNELDEYETPGHDVVWIASGIEQLLQTSGRNRDTQISQHMTELLGDAWSAEGGRSLRAWMSEFYAKRSEIHGRMATTSHWPYWAHALLGTVSYILLVQHLLAATGRYDLTDHNVTDAAAFPHRIECLRDADQTGQEEFARCWGDAIWDGTVARVHKEFGLSEQS